MTDGFSFDYKKVHTGQELHDGGEWITLRRGLLEELMELPEGALKIYIYLRSLDAGESFSAAIPTIKAAIGCATRSVNRSLKLLRQKKLIRCKGGAGGLPYLYSFPLPASKLDLVPEAIQETPIPAGIEEASAASAISVPQPATPPAAVMELISAWRRPGTAPY